MTAKTKLILLDVGIMVVDIAVLGGLSKKYWQQVFPVFDFVFALNLMVVIPLVFFACYKYEKRSNRRRSNKRLLRRLRREAYELYGMEFFVNSNGQDIYNVGFRKKVKPWYEGSLYLYGNRGDAIERLEQLRRQYTYDTIARMRSDRRKAAIQQETRKL